MVSNFKLILYLALRPQFGEYSQQLGADISNQLDGTWDKQITKELGFKDYTSMIATLT